MGSLFIYTIAYKFNIMSLISPVFGGILCFIILHKTSELGKLNNWQGKPITAYLFFSFLTTPVIYLFSYDYIEMVQPSLPFLVYGIITLASYIKGYRKYFPGALGLILACFFHGMNCFLLPLLFIAPFLKSLEKNNFHHDIYLLWKNVIIIWFILLIAPCLFFLLSAGTGLTTKLFRFFGYGWTYGNIFGGGDNILFVPLLPTSLKSFTMFSSEDLSSFSNIIFLTFPGIIFFLVAYIRSKDALASHNDLNVIAFFGSQILGYMCFAFLVNFDLGFPRDIDLMFGMSIIQLPFWVSLLIMNREKISYHIYPILVLNIVTSSIIAVNVMPD